MKVILLFASILLWIGAPIVGYTIGPASSTGKAIMIAVCLFMVAALHVLYLAVSRRALGLALASKESYGRNAAAPRDSRTDQFIAEQLEKIATLTNVQIMAKVQAWQAAGFVHELTCGVDSRHLALEARERVESGVAKGVALFCPTCGYEQVNIPPVVLSDYLEQQREGLKKIGLIK
jgi:hypothetical protein